MTTFNRLYRASRFHLCVHTGNKGNIGFEPSEYRNTQYTFVSYGTGYMHMFFDDKHEVVTYTQAGDLLDLRRFIDSSVVGQATENYRIISFNSWKKSQVWKGRLLGQNETQISSQHSYSTLVCFQGTFKINGKEVPELSYVELKQNKIYNIDSSDSFVGIFEEGNA